MTPKERRTDPLSRTTHYIKLKFSETDTILATATGFIYEYEEIYYLITNGHNVTGVNPFDGKQISDTGGIPDKIVTDTRYILENNMLTQTGEFAIDLYMDEDRTQPQWFIHPVFGYKVDVIAIPIIDKTTAEQKKLHFTPINSYDFQTDFPPEVSDDVFILGYPQHLTSPMNLPIWKRGTIATEPSFDLQKLPYLLIDTGTRSGMSGSPVIFQRHGFHSLTNEIDDKTIMGRIRNFLGVYSGRIGYVDNYHSQLGIVWRGKVIEEILERRYLGTIDIINNPKSILG